MNLFCLSYITKDMVKSCRMSVQIAACIMCCSLISTTIARPSTYILKQRIEKKDPELAEPNRRTTLDNLIVIINRFFHGNQRHPSESERESIADSMFDFFDLDNNNIIDRSEFRATIWFINNDRKRRNGRPFPEVESLSK
ncbi:uncharacterized protein LOC106180061 [Lingula anatina]|uniref:Uncharacterized protein LOC106171991 n=1 Tax=Lingula anatina TaxID=7574 RepID=A0A1S3JC78_LINAN|nr:uncharacterized protein LOC106171991 [Lingula anatina]XP_013419386.1 uncharacterized protein LOC106180061 [Lingula anatina]|eukprot:XP_013408007.1 uncharacterized protein LOC106171991 [Lingula anatina]